MRTTDLKNFWLAIPDTTWRKKRDMTTLSTNSGAPKMLHYPEYFSEFFQII